MATATTLNELSIGDRFLKAGEKQKNVYQVLGVVTDRWGNVTAVSYAKREEIKNKKKFKLKPKPEEIAVIFLRNVND